MTTTSPSSQPTRTDPVAPAPSRQPRVGWLSLLVAAGCATIASFVIPMIIAGSIETFFLAMAAPIVLGLLVVWRWRRTGIVVLGVVLLAELLASAPFLTDALTHPETPGDFLPLTLFTVATLVGSVAAVPAFRAAQVHARPTSRSATPVAVSAVLVLVAATAVSIVAAGRVDSVTAQPGDVALTTKDFQFDTRTITTDTETVAVTVTNDDATRHTFTIDELGVDLNVPPGTTQRVTFPADTGTYRFYCIPHATDMAGELVVR
jgi:plastocyanin